MNTFVQGVEDFTTTENGMLAYKSTTDKVVDFFYKIGSARGIDISENFTDAYVADPINTLKILAWARDIRGGAGERETFRKFLLLLEISCPDDAKKLIKMIPTIGRWDDMLIFQTDELKHFAWDTIKKALQDKNGLAAKWMPRNGKIAREIRDYLKMSPKQWRKTLVSLTDVVETKMCAKEWDNIEFSKVPSLAASRYRNAFTRNSKTFSEYVEKLTKGEEKVNAGAVYPYDVVKNIYAYFNSFDADSETQLKFIEQQWNALPDITQGKNILPIVDVSGSMGFNISNKLTAMQIAVSMGLYFADKNTGAFKDVWLPFSSRPKLHKLSGNICEKYRSINNSEWGNTTNLEAAIKIILDTAIENKALPEDMPEYLIIFSDMQFNECSVFNQSAIKMLEENYKNAGYIIPKVIFWNLNTSYDNVPAKKDKNGVILLSGFSPFIVKNLLNMENITPEIAMFEIINNPRYNWENY